MAEKETKKGFKVDGKFLVGFFLIVFLVLINSYVKDIPWHIVAIPALLMGIDVGSIISAFRGDNKK